jgi:uncharacterized coiled-coil protein SlyX
MSDADRIAELELELMAQRDLLDALNGELTGANARIDVLEKRVERLERQLESVLAVVEAPASEKPPHY